MSEFFRKRLFERSGSAGDTFRETFRQIASRKGPDNGYLAGIRITIKLAVTGEEESDPLPAIVIWNVIQGLTVKGLDHDWMVDLPGAAVTLMNLCDETIGGFDGAGVGSFHMVSMSADGDSHDIYHTYLIPIMPRRYSPGNRGRGNTDGGFPLAAMLEQGEVVVNTQGLKNAPAGWAIDNDNLEVECYLDNYWTEKSVIPAPWRVDWQIDASSEVQFPARKGRVDLLVATDDEFGSLVQPTAKIKIETNGITKQDDLDGEQCRRSADMPRNCPSGLFFNDFIRAILPSDMSSKLNMADCTILRARDFNGSQYPDGRLLYMTRRYLALDSAKTANYADSLDIPPSAVNDQRLHRVGSKPAGTIQPGHGGFDGIPITIG